MPLRQARLLAGLNPRRHGVHEAPRQGHRPSGREAAQPAGCVTSVWGYGAQGTDGAGERRAGGIHADTGGPPNNLALYSRCPVSLALSRCCDAPALSARLTGCSGLCKQDGDTRCVVLACDGIFDVMSNQEAGTLVARHLSDGGGVREGCGALIKRAFAKKSDDNLTAVIALCARNFCRPCRGRELCWI